MWQWFCTHLMNSGNCLLNIYYLVTNNVNCWTIFFKNTKYIFDVDPKKRFFTTSLQERDIKAFIAGVVGSLPEEGKWQHNPIVQMVSILNHINSIIAIYFMIARLTFITRALNEVMSNTRRWNYDTSLNGVHSRYSIPIHERAHDFIKSPGNWSHHYKVSGN